MWEDNHECDKVSSEFRDFANDCISSKTKSDDFKFKQCLRLLTASIRLDSDYRMKMVECLLAHIVDGKDLVKLTKGFYTSNIRNPE